MNNQYANDFTRTTQTYYNELKKYKPLTKAKEKKLLRQCKKGSLQAKNEILESNLKFVFDVAKHYTGRGVSISELISEGNMGLLKAIEKFDISKDVKFISYAIWWIRQAMLESIKKKKLMNFVDIEPNTNNEVSFNNKLIYDEEDDTICNDFLSDEDEQTNYELKCTQKEMISKLLNCLDERERDIIEEYYGINGKKELTLMEIGQKYKLSGERVRQINKVSLRKMRTKMLLLRDDELENLFG